MVRVRKEEDSLVPSARELSRQFTRSLLKDIYDRGRRIGRIPSPDEAMEKMQVLVAQLAGPTSSRRESQKSFPAELARFDIVQHEREAHHYAVDLYYAAIRPRRGAPPLHPAYLKQLLAWSNEGLSPRKIAIRLGMGSSHESEDRVRKQLLIAKRNAGKK